MQSNSNKLSTNDSVNTTNTANTTSSGASYADRVRGNRKYPSAFNPELIFKSNKASNLKIHVANYTKPKIVISNEDTGKLLPSKSYNPYADSRLRAVNRASDTVNKLAPITPKSGNLTPITPGSVIFKAHIDGEDMLLKKVSYTEVVSTKGKKVFIDPTTNKPVHLSSSTLETKPSSSVNSLFTPIFNGNNEFYNHRNQSSANSSDSKAWSNTAVAGITDPNSDHVNLETRKKLIKRNISEEIAQRSRNADCLKEVSPNITTNEIDINKKGLRGKAKLGFNFVETNLGSKVKSIYIKYHDVSKRHFYWTIWEGNKNNYYNYQDFKRNWDPKTSIFKQIWKETKTDLYDTVRDIVNVRDPFNVGKNRKISSSSKANISYPKNFRGTTGSFK